MKRNTHRSTAPEVLGGSNLALLDLQRNRVGHPGATALARAVRTPPAEKAQAVDRSVVAVLSYT